jgi:hypothetical protein
MRVFMFSMYMYDSIIFQNFYSNIRSSLDHIYQDSAADEPYGYCAFLRRLHGFARLEYYFRVCRWHELPRFVSRG